MEHAPDGYVERQIRQAMEDGEFDHLAGLGEPIPSLALTTDPAWWAKRRLAQERARDRALQAAAAAHRSATDALDLRNEAEVRAELDRLQKAIDRANAELPPGERVEDLDQEALVTLWRRMARLRR